MLTDSLDCETIEILSVIWMGETATDGRFIAFVLGKLDFDSASL